MRMGNPQLRNFPVLTAAWLWVAAAVFPAMAGEVSAVSVAAGATGTRAEIELNGAGEFKTLALSSPDRLVVDLPASTAARSLKLPAGAGIVTSVRTGQPTPGTLRVVFDLSSSVVSLKPRIEPSAGGSRLVIEWPGDGPAPAAVVSAPAPTQKPPADDASAARATAALTSQVVQQAVASPTPTATDTAQALSPQAILNGQSTGVQVPPNAPAAGAATATVPTYTIATGKPAPVGTVAAGTPATTETPAPEPAPPQVPAPVQAGMRPLVIAIDPGHGGQDPGAIGPGGTYEKNIVLAISKELARQINATPGMRAYLIRDTDVYVERPQRARKARGAKADMFVSIHADAAENRSAWGSSVYVLSTRGASSQHARWLADKENASDLVGGVRLTQDTLSSVLLDLAQSGHMKASQDAAGHVLTGLKGLGKTHKPQIEFANFEVLRNSDMPAMLVETGFISNHEEEKRLRDPAHQRKVAAAVLVGIQSYFTNQPPPGTLFAARAQAKVQAETSTAAGAGAP